MDDPRLTRLLRTIEEPAVPDSAFLDGLFEELVEELGFRRARHTLELVPNGRSSAPGGAAARPRRRLWPPVLLVAALVIGGGLAVGAGVGGFIDRGDVRTDAAPVACDLVSTAEIGAIVGVPVTRETGSGSPQPAGSCAYQYAPARTRDVPRNLEIAIDRPADPVTEWARIRQGVGGITVDGVGDASVLFPISEASSTQTLAVLRGPYVLYIGYLADGNADPISPQQMAELARIIVARL